MPSNSRKKDISHRIKLEGEVTIYNSTSIKSVITEALKKNKEIEIDLAKVSEIDSAGLQLLLLAKREADRNNMTLRLIKHSKAVVEILNLYQMDEYFSGPTVPLKTGSQPA
jgi:anti-sigma B factor antagonist